MKNIYFLLGFLFLFTTTTYSQSHIISSSTGTTSEFDYQTVGADILIVPAAEVLSNWRTIPFPFSFYGSPVSGYYASDNGYITFDSTDTVSYDSNTALPDASGPNHAIYAFWDAVNLTSGSGSADRVTTWTYGTTPNRVHVIQWYSVTPESGTGFLYATIRLYECGNFDIINSYGTATGMTATIGCENSDGTLGTMLAGSPNIDYPTTAAGPEDDLIYTFIYSDTDYDLAMISSDLSKFATLGSNTVSGTLRNMGFATVTNFDLHYTVDGGAAVTDNITGVSIAPGETYAFSHSTVWDVPAGGVSHVLCLYTDNINGNPDQRTCNDLLCTDLFANLGISAEKSILVEEFTGAWCGWCPDGAVILDEIIAANPGRAYGISIHSGDDMEYADGIVDEFSTGLFPNAMIDRYVFEGEPDEPHSRSTWAGNAATRIAAYTPVEVTMTENSWDPVTREISFTAKANFVDYENGDLRFLAYITEDEVVGSGSGYDQVNYLNSETGHPYFGLGDPIVGYEHNHTLRANPSGAMGNAGIISSFVTPGDTFVETFTYTLPAGYNEEKIKLTVAVANFSTTTGEREIHNSYGEPLAGMGVGIAPELAVGFIQLFPNPTTGLSTLALNLNRPMNAKIQVFDAFGKQVIAFENQQFSAGKSSQQLDLSGLSQGMYFVHLLAKDGSTLTQKIMIQK